MARARYIKPEFFKDEDLSRVSLAARLLFVGLWSMADRAGRLEDRPLRIKAELFPYEGVEVDPLLAELAGAKKHGSGAFILRYEVSGRRYIQIANFEKHQKCHIKEPASTLPGPAPAGTGSPGFAGANPPESESVSESVNGVGVSKPELAPSGSVCGPNPEREAYVREVWGAWCSKRGGELPEPSPAEHDLARALYEDGVPLRVALRAITDCSKPPKGARTQLLYCEPAFHEAARHWRKAVTA